MSWLMGFIIAVTVWGLAIFGAWTLATMQNAPPACTALPMTDAPVKRGNRLADYR